MSRVARSWLRAAPSRLYSTAKRYEPVRSLRHTGNDSVDVFDLHEPAVFKKHFTDIPAIRKWFAWSDTSRSSCELNLPYLERFGDTMVPIETRRPSRSDPNTTRFERLETSFDVFLAHMAPFPVTETRMYLAQYPLADLPAPLQADLPTPALLAVLGRGDIYASSLWMGKPPTQTPLHRDPNPNLFVQLAGQKVARLMRPVIGRGVYERVRLETGRTSNAGNLRGEEMMEGEEMERLEKAIWDDEEAAKTQGEDAVGVEAELDSGDGLYIPLGWWHAVRGIGTGANASVSISRGQGSAD